MAGFALLSIMMRPDQGDSLHLQVLLFLLGALLTLTFWCFVWLLFARPLRQRNRALLLTDALRFAVSNGHSPENVLMQLCADRALRHRGMRRAGRCLRRAYPLETALQALGGCVPVQIRGLLIAGVRAGTLDQVLPLADRILCRQRSRTQAFSHYLFLILFYASILLIISLTQSFVLPKLVTIFDDLYAPASNPLLSSPFFAIAHTASLVVGGCFIFLLLSAGSYALGKRLLPHSFHTPVDFLEHKLLPWRRKRNQRDFALMLCASLDSGIGETEAIHLAAETTGNTWLKRQARRAAAQLAGGKPLPEVCRRLFEVTGEFAWRLRSSHLGQGRGSALEAVDGWCRHLEAGAYRDEQAAAQFFSTAIILATALVIGSTAAAVIQSLAGIIQGMVLW